MAARAPSLLNQALHSVSQLTRHIPEVATLADWETGDLL